MIGKPVREEESGERERRGCESGGDGVKVGKSRLLTKLEKQVPRGLQPARKDKNTVLITAHLKVRPFKTGLSRVF